MSDCHFIAHGHFTTKLFTFIELILPLMLNNTVLRKQMVRNTLLLLLAFN